MRNLNASTLSSLLGLCLVLPMSANAALTCGSAIPPSRLLASQCAQCHESGDGDLGSYSELINIRVSLIIAPRHPRFLGTQGQ